MNHLASFLSAYLVCAALLNIFLAIVIPTQFYWIQVIVSSMCTILAIFFAYHARKERYEIEEDFKVNKLHVF